ncbi:MAG TPA: hypothetical protein VIT91_06200 [Chthoniobacterales bacterium]
MRLGFAGLLWYRMPHAVPPTVQPFPNGLAHWIDLTFLANPAIFTPARWIFLAMLALYVVGRLVPLALSYLLCLNVAVYTLWNSQGWIGHTDQIISLTLLALTLFHIFAAISRFRPKDGRSLGDVEISISLQVIAATYVVAGITKLIKSDGMWLAQLPNITVQIEKTNEQFFYDFLRHPNPGLTDWLNSQLIAHPWLAYPFFGPGLIVELAAFLLPYGRRHAAILGLALLAMHGLISLTMQITFTTNIWMLIIFAVNVPFWAVAVWKRIAGQKSA